MKNLIILLGLLLFAACSSAPKKELSDSEIKENLLRLSHNNDVSGIEKYFNENSTCTNPDQVVGCMGRETGFQIENRDDVLTSNNFIQNYQTLISKFKKDMGQCSGNVICLSQIEVSSPLNYQDRHQVRSLKANKKTGPCTKEVYTLADGSELTVFDKISESLTESWLPEDLQKSFYYLFIEKAAAMTAKNLPLIESNKNRLQTQKIASDEKTQKIISLIKSKKCIALSGYNILQKLSANTFEVALPDTQHSFQASQEMGGFKSNFIKAGRHAVLKTTKTEFKSSGYLPPDFHVIQTGLKKIKMANGFDDTFPVYEESPDCHELFKQLYNK